MTDKLPPSFASTDELLSAYWRAEERIKELERQLEDDEDGARLELHQIRVVLHDGTSEDAYNAAVKWKQRAEEAERTVEAFKTVAGILEENFGPFEPITDEGKRMLKIYNDTTAEFGP